MSEELKAQIEEELEGLYDTLEEIELEICSRLNTLRKLEEKKNEQKRTDKR